MDEIVFVFFFFKQKTAYEIYQCDWSSDVCSSDLSVVEQLLGVDAVYVTLDIDGLDPAFAPGTGTPKAGGLSTRDVLVRQSPCPSIKTALGCKPSAFSWNGTCR